MRSKRKIYFFREIKQMFLHMICVVAVLMSENPVTFREDVNNCQIFVLIKNIVMEKKYLNIKENFLWNSPTSFVLLKVLLCFSLDCITHFH